MASSPSGGGFFDDFFGGGFFGDFFGGGFFEALHLRFARSLWALQAPAH